MRVRVLNSLYKATTLFFLTLISITLTTSALKSNSVVSTISRTSSNLVDETQNDPTITTLAVAGNSYCRSSALNVFFTSVGEFPIGNQFTVQLSDAFGSFASPTTISVSPLILSGTDLSGNIFCVIPGTVTAGTAYRVRIVSSSPAVNGSDNGSDITITNLISPPIPTITVNGPTEFCFASATTFLISSAANGNSWYNIVDGGTITNSFIGVVNTGIYYTLLTGENGCQTNSVPVNIFVNDPIFTQTAYFVNGQQASPDEDVIVNICPGEEVQIGVSIQGGVYPINLVLTSDGGNSLIFADGVTSSPYLFTTSQPGTYQTLFLQDSFSTNCGSNGNTGTVTITELPPPPVDFSYAPFCGTPSLEPILGNGFFSGGIFSFSPLPNDGATIDPSTGVISNAVSGATYTVVYNVEGPACPLTSSATFTVNFEDVTDFTIAPFCPSGNSDAPVLALGFKEGGVFTFNPSPVDGATVDAQSGVIVGASPLTTYTVQYTSPQGACQNTSTTTVTTFGLPIIELDTTQTQCLTPTGSVSSTVSGGVAPYTYLWSSGETTESISNKPAGNYTITVTDANGCFASESITIENSNQPIIDLEVTNASCGDENGSITINVVSGGTAPFTAIWNNNATDFPTLGPLAIGTYSVTVTDNLGCVANASATIANEGAPVLQSQVITPATCNASDGSVVITVSGSEPLEYAWSNGTNLPTLNGVPAGDYSLTVTDVNNCELDLTFTVPVFNPVIISGTTITQPTCENPLGGAATVTLSGGTEPFDLNWSSGEEILTIINKGPGSYTFTVIDANTCTDEVTITLNPVNPIVVDTATLQPTCNNADGSITLDITGGSGNYNVVWSDNSTDINRTNLVAGTYSVIVTDQADQTCTAQFTFTLTNSNQPIASLAKIDTDCFENNGSITLTVTGGSGTFTTLWDPNGETNVNTLTGLGQGTYSVTVTDENGCVVTVSETININNPVVATFVKANTTCANSNGLIDLTVSGGVGPYTFLWNDGNTNDDRVLLAAGSYTVIITDSQGCEAEVTVDILPSLAPTISASIVQPTCGNNDGSIDITPVNATAPISYSWTKNNVDFANSQDLTNISSGLYNLTLTDFAGCVATFEQNLLNSDVPVPTFDVTPTLCGQEVGAITVSFAQGIGNFELSWSNGQTGNTITNLADSCYTLTLSNNEGCIETFEVCVPVEDGFQIEFTAQNPSCNQSNGSLTASVTNGANVTFEWPDLSVVGPTISNVGPGTYTVIGTDENGCSITATFTLVDEGTPVISEEVLPVTCLGNDGEIILTVTGGTEPYTYVWDGFPLVIGNTIADLPIGSYTVTVTDDGGCSVSKTIQVGEAQPLIINFTKVDENCGNGEGSINITITNGNGSELYEWTSLEDPEFLSFDENLENLSAGTYDLTVVNDQGCEASISVTINNVIQFAVSSIVTTPAACGQNNGSITVNILSGEAPFTFAWCDGTTSTTNTISDLAPGECLFTITDNNGCSLDTSVTIIGVGGPEIVLTATPASCGLDNGTASVEITGGTTPYFISWSNGASQANINDLAAGVYSVIVTDFNNCSAQDSIEVTGSPAVTINIPEPTPSQCNVATGFATVNVLTGTEPYNYSWSNGVFTADNPNLSAGNYTVTVTDANDCSATASVTIINSNDPVLSFEITNATCGNSNGAIDLTITNASNDINVVWNGNINSQDLANIAAGDYTVVVTDNETGCSVDSTVSVINTDAPSATLTLSNDTICEGESITVTIDLAGSTTYDLVYSVNGVNTTVTTTNTPIILNFSPIVNTTYELVSLTSPEIQNCQGNLFGSPQILVVNPTPVQPVITVTGPTTFCAGDSTFLTSSYQSGNLWSPGGATTQSIFVSTSGSYTVTQTNEFGCSSTSDAVVIQVNSTADVQVIPTLTICEGDSVQVTASGATSYLWSPTIGLSGSIIANPLVGPAVSTTYTITGTNDCGTGSATLEVTVLPNPDNQIIAPASICENTTYTFSLANPIPTGATVIWAPSSAIVGNNTGTTVEVSVSGSFTLTATITSSNGCDRVISLPINPLPQPTAPVITANGPTTFCEGDNVILSSTVGINVVWSPVNVANVLNLSATTSGSYFVTITDFNGCTAQSNTIDVNVISLPSPLIVPSGNTLFCEGQSITLTSAIAGDWTGPVTATNSTSVTASLSGTYTITVDNNGCQGTESINVVVFPNPTPPTISPNGVQELCEGTSLALTSSYTDGNTWSLNDLNSNSINVTAAGSYTVTYTDNNGCSATSEPVVVTLKPNAPPIITGDSLVCANVDVNVLLTASPGFTSYQWVDGPATPTYNVTASGTYTVIGTNANGCQAQASFTVNINPAIELTITSPIYFDNFNISVNGGSDGSIDLTTTGGTPTYTYTWVDNATVTSEDRNNLPAGTYTVFVTDSKGCVDSTSIILIQPDVLKLPNGYTPNGDGFNDNFVISGVQGYPNNTFVVYNRWGNVVYSANGYSNQWNGQNNNGTDLPESTYFVILEIPGKETLKGYVDLRRK